MRVAVVAGADAGHAFPAFALAELLAAAGDEAVVFTGPGWIALGTERSIDTRELLGLAPRPQDDDSDIGQKMHSRAAHIATEMLDSLTGFDLIVADVLTPGAGMAAEILGIPWVEMSPHPLYKPSRGLPPIGSGMAPGTGIRRVRDIVLRQFTKRDHALGARQRVAARGSIGLPPKEPGPAAHIVGTIPALEVPRPDWPARTHVVGPLLWEPTAHELALPEGDDPLVMVAPSTALIGADGMLDAVLEGLAPNNFGRRVRVAVSSLEPVEVSGDWITAGLGRQDLMLTAASVVVCGGGHGMLAKALTAGRPVITIPGGGDQWELANRVVRQGSGQLIRPVTADAIAAAVRRALDDPAFASGARRAAASARNVADPVAVCHSALMP